MQNRTLRLAVLAVAAVAMLAMMASTSAAAPAQAPVQQAMTCRWEKLSASMPQALYFSGAAWDSVNNQLYLNAGLDQTDATKRTVQQLNLSDPDIKKASASTVTVSGNQDYWGSAGGFRPAGDTSLAIFAGGATGSGSGTEGQGQRVTQGFTPKTKAWATVSQLGQGVSLAAAAFDTKHGALIVVGGVQDCDFFSVDSTNPLKCDDSVNNVSFIKFDPATGAPTVSAGPTSGGPGRMFGGSLVYDSKGERMLWFGGVDSAGGNGRNVVYALDLKDADLTKAKWATLATAGTTPPGRALHGAAYDENHNWMVVYGGVGRSFFTTNESALTDTFALDLGQTPPKWTNLSASQPGERVGAGMVYDTNHKVSVLTSGRRKFATSSQNVLRDNWTLTCEAQATPVPTATRDPNITPSVTPTKGSGGGGPGWTPEPCTPKACPGLDTLVPAPVIANALANPATIEGYCQLRNPGVPPSPYNIFRQSLTLRNRGVPYNPVNNGVIFKAGCY
jgi:hypothetical protein